MEIVYHVACSLDGYIADRQGGVEWLDRIDDAGEDYGYPEFSRSLDGIVMGSRTYEFALHYGEWVYADKPSWVLTRRDLPLAHPTVTLTRDDPVAVVESLQARGLQRIWLLGGGSLAASFARERLISEYIIAVLPVLLGGGIRLFEGESATTELEFRGAQSYSNGIVHLTYRSKPLGD